MIKFVILGFLLKRNLTGYDIKQIMKRSTANFMNASFGSIYPELSKLEGEGLISSTKEIVKGRHKKLYFLNESGRKLFLDWLQDPEDFVSSNVHVKVFFFSEIPKETAIDLITKLIDNINSRLQSLEDLKEQLGDKVEFYQISTLYYGIDYLKFSTGWYNNFLQEIISKK